MKTHTGPRTANTHRQPAGSVDNRQPAASTRDRSVLRIPGAAERVSPHGRIDSLPVAICRYEEMLDHAVRTQQLDAIQKQLRIRRNALTDGVCQFEPLLTIVTAPGVFIRLEQRHEILNQQGEIKGVGVARVQNQALLIKRHGLLQGVVANLRTQVSGSHSNAGFVDFNPVLFR